MLKFLITQTIIEISSVNRKTALKRTKTKVFTDKNNTDMNGALKVDRQTVTQRVARYIRDNHISVLQIQRDIAISADKLRCENDSELDAAEFLELCRYLNVRPESFRRNE